jgi:mercuric ion transport protein
MSRTGVEKSALAVGGLAAILVSACCLGPLVLVTVGLGGAWIGNLTALEPFRPLFIVAALVAMVLAWRRIYRPVEKCQPGEICAMPETRYAYKILFWIVSALVLVALGLPYILPLFF